MQGTRAPPSEPAGGGQHSLLSDEDVVNNLLRGEAVQNDVQEALTRYSLVRTRDIIMISRASVDCSWGSTRSGSYLEGRRAMI